MGFLETSVFSTFFSDFSHLWSERLDFASTMMGKLFWGRPKKIIFSTPHHPSYTPNPIFKDPTSLIFFENIFDLFCDSMMIYKHFSGQHSLPGGKSFSKMAPLFFYVSGRFFRDQKDAQRNFMQNHTILAARSLIFDGFVKKTLISWIFGQK